MPETASTYDIELLDFPDVGATEAAAALAKAFRVDKARAQRLIDKVPVTVRVQVERQDVQKYMRALLAIGADVRVSGGGRNRVYRAADFNTTRRELNPGDIIPIADMTGPTTSVATASHSSLPELDDQRSTRGAAVLKRTRSRESVAVGAGRVRCPKCGFEQPEADSCARCGIIISKYAGAERSGDGSRDRAGSLTPGGVRPIAGPVSIYMLSPEDDDGLFQSRRSPINPGRILREAALLSGVHGPVGTEITAAHGATEALVRRPTGEAAERRRGSVDVGFWNKVGRGYLYALSGAAWQWLALMAFIGALSYGVLRMMARAPLLPLTIVGLFVLIILFSAFLAAQWRLFTFAFHAAVADRDDDRVPPVYGMEDFKSEFVLPGELLCLAALILWAPFIYVVFSAFERGAMPSASAVMLTALLPLIYWPMGMAWIGASGRLTEIFIITGIIKGMVIGGLEYAFIAALGVLAFFAVDRFVAAVGEVSFVSWALLYAVLGYASGVQGYLLGRLLRRRPHMIAGTEIEETL